MIDYRYCEYMGNNSKCTHKKYSSFFKIFSRKCKQDKCKLEKKFYICIYEKGFKQFLGKTIDCDDKTYYYIKDDIVYKCQFGFFEFIFTELTQIEADIINEKLKSGEYYTELKYSKLQSRDK